jgi:two-component system response regulator QseB/two-component system response regulator BasR
MKLCLVEDDLDLGKGLAGTLRDAGHDVAWVRRAAEAVTPLRDPDIDAVILDLGLPDVDGIHLLRRLRTQRRDLPVIIITARTALEDRISGLDAGADDYLVKPFAVQELLARLRAVARRTSATPQAQAWRLKDLDVDEQRYQVTRDGTALHLSPAEFALLLQLVTHPHRVLTRDELVQRALSGYEGQTLDVHMSNLRRKLGAGYIRTIRGVGYAVIS